MSNRVLSTFWAVLLLPAFLLASLQRPTIEQTDGAGTTHKELKLTKGHDAQLVQAGIEVAAPAIQALLPVVAWALPLPVSGPKLARLLPCQHAHAQFVRYLRASISPQAP